jgi:hypothetical protein
MSEQDTIGVSNFVQDVLHHDCGACHDHSATIRALAVSIQTGGLRIICGEEQIDEERYTMPIGGYEFLMRPITNVSNNASAT